MKILCPFNEKVHSPSNVFLEPSLNLLFGDQDVLMNIVEDTLECLNKPKGETAC